MLWAWDSWIYWQTLFEHYFFGMHPKMLMGEDVPEEEADAAFDDGGCWVPGEAYKPWLDQHGQLMLFGLSWLTAAVIAHAFGVH